MPSEKYFIGLVIALVCVVLFFFAVKKLTDVRVSQEDENAQHVLDEIIAKTDLLQDGQSAEQLVQGFQNSENWYIVGFNLGVTRPNKCLLNNCLCICKSTGVLNCQKNGFCREIKDRKVNTSARILADYVIPVAGPGGIPAVVKNSKIGLVRLSKNILSLNINKQKDILSFDTVYGPFNSFDEDWVKTGLANPWSGVPAEDYIIVKN